jgi:hypothetical protein
MLVVLTAFLSSGCVVVHQTERTGGPPPWAPAHGYRAKQEARYMYYPRYNIYVDLRTGVYHYRSGNRWVQSRSLPPGVSRRDLERSRRVATHSPPNQGNRGKNQNPRGR